MQSLKRNAPILLMLAAISLGAASCSPPDKPADSSGEPVDGGTMRVHLSAEVDSWNPYTTRTAASANVVELLYPRLVRESAGTGSDGFDPWLAESWTLSDDGLAARFNLRPEARWSDGTPVTCQDVRFTWQAQISEDLAWSGASYKQRIAEVRCPDAHTALFEFTEPSANQILDVNDNAIVPAAYRDIPLDQWRATVWEERLLSSGPFRLVSVEPGQRATLERDPHWWGEAARVDRVVFRIHPDAAQGMNALEAGAVDVFAGIDPLRAAAFRTDPGVRLQGVPARAYTFIGWNQLEPGAYAEDRRSRGCAESCEESVEDLRRLLRKRPHPILADRRVRNALSMAIDRIDLIEGLWQGYAKRGSTPIVSSLWAHREDLEPTFDPEGADRLLDEAGWTERDADGVRMRGGRRLELKILAYADNKTRMDALERVAANLRRHGVALVSDPVSRAEFIRRAWGKEFDGVISSWRAGSRIDPQVLFHANAAVDRGNNFIAWFPAESDSLLDRATAANRRETALPLWHAWQELFHREQPYAILYERETILGLRSRVRGARPTPFNPLDRLDRWWLDPQQSSETPG